MLTLVKKGIKEALRIRTGRDFTVFADDTLIVSYPKSGNTWTRFLVANLLSKGTAVDFTNIENIVPDIYAHTDGELKVLGGPRVLKSHEYFDPRYRSVICIVRDPRDVAISYFHHVKKMKTVEETYGFDRFLEKFISGAWGAQYGSWGENVGSWLGAREGSAGFLLLKYEEMRADPVPQLRKIASFLYERGGLPAPASEEALARAVEQSRFEHMQLAEKSQWRQWATTKKSNPDRPFVRSGRPGEWRDVMSAAQAERVADVWRGVMVRLGYLTNGGAA